ncbi:hypothetical protein ACJJTC_016307 [Scirpophaga incertulas]
MDSLRGNSESVTANKLCSENNQHDGEDLPKFVSGAVGRRILRALSSDCGDLAHQLSNALKPKLPVTLIGIELTDTSQEQPVRCFATSIPDVRRNAAAAVFPVFMNSRKHIPDIKWEDLVIRFLHLMS